MGGILAAEVPASARAGMAAERPTFVIMLQAQPGIDPIRGLR
jgi:hypothetical protein